MLPLLLLQRLRCCNDARDPHSFQSLPWQFGEADEFLPLLPRGTVGVGSKLGDIRRRGQRGHVKATFTSKRDLHLYVGSVQRLSFKLWTLCARRSIHCNVDDLTFLWKARVSHVLCHYGCSLRHGSECPVPLTNEQGKYKIVLPTTNPSYNMYFSPYLG